MSNFSLIICTFYFWLQTYESFEVIEKLFKSSLNKNNRPNDPYLNHEKTEKGAWCSSDDQKLFSRLQY